MKKFIWVGVLLIIILSLVPYAYRTIAHAGDAYGLVTLATMRDGAMSVNPYTENGYFINQKMAMWLLMNTDYPYARCSRLSESIGNCGTSLVGFIGRGLDLPDTHTGRAYALLDYFIARGEPLDELDNGLAPVHEAVLYKNPQYLERLLNAGADPYIRINRPDKPYHGYDTFRFLDMLEKSAVPNLTPMREVLDRFRSASRHRS